MTKNWFVFNPLGNWERILDSLTTFHVRIYKGRFRRRLPYTSQVFWTQPIFQTQLHVQVFLSLSIQLCKDFQLTCLCGDGLYFNGAPISWVFRWPSLILANIINEIPSNVSCASVSWNGLSETAGWACSRNLVILMKNLEK